MPKILKVCFMVIAIAGLFLISPFLKVKADVQAQSYNATLSKSFNPATIGRMEKTRLSVVVTNPNNFILDSVSWSDDLVSVQPGLRVATPANIVENCGGTVTAVEESTTIELIGGSVAANGGTCTVSVDVVTSVSGNLTNTIPAGALTATENGGPGTITNGADASAILNVATFDFPAEINKQFNPISIAPGDVSRLSISIYNSNTFELINAAWIDNLVGIQTGLKIANPPNISSTCDDPLANPPTAVTALAGGTTISLERGKVPAQLNSNPGSCTVSVDVTSTTPGNLINTIPAGALSSTGIGGTVTVGNTSPSSATLQVDTVAPPSITKSFTPNTVWVGQTSQLTIDIKNNDLTHVLSEITLTDILNDPAPNNIVIANPVSASLSGCGGTAADLLTANSGSSSLILNNASIAADSTCRILVNVVSSVAGSYTNTIAVGAIGSKQGVTNASPASAPLNVQASSILKSFFPTTIQAGEISLLTITLRNPTATPYTGVAIDDVMPGTVLELVPGTAATDCGTGIAEVVTTGRANDTVRLTGGTIPAGSVATPNSCTITVSVTTPDTALTQTHTNTIPANALVTDQGISNLLPVSTNLGVQRLSIGVVKGFSPIAIQQGGTTTVTITLQNRTSNPLNIVSFTDTLPTGLVPVAPETAATTCSGGTAASTTVPSAVTLTGGIIPPGTVAVPGTCRVTVNVTTNGSVFPATYTNVVDPNTITTLEGATNLDAASRSINVYQTDQGVTASKSFSPASILAGSNSRLRISLRAPDDEDLTNFSVTDILPENVTISNSTAASLSGCGAGTLTAAATGTGTITLSNASITKATTCQIDVYVTGSVSNVYTNTIAATQITNDQGQRPATDFSASLTVSHMTISKAFYPNAVSPGGLSTLTITLSNTNPAPITGVSLTDNLTTMGGGDISIAPTPNGKTTCGSGTVPVSGGSQIITLSNGSIPAQVGGVPGICTVSVDVQASSSIVTLPTTRTNTVYRTNVSGTIFGLGTIINPVADAAANLLITPLSVGVVKGFDPLTVFGGSSSTLSVQLVNPNNTVLSGITFTDTMPLGMFIANPPNLSTGTCGGALTAIPGERTFTFSGGVLNANKRCTLTLGTTMNVNGNRTNTITAGAVTTFNGASNPQAAQASLTNLPGASITKFFSPNSIIAGETSLLTIRITNTGNIKLTNLGFTDNLPAALQILASPAPDNKCNGVLTAAEGTQTIKLLGGEIPAGPGTTCDMVVAVTGTTAGTYTNTIAKNSLTSAEGATNTEPATDTLIINANPLLQLIKTLDINNSSPAPYTIGDSLAYQIVAKNIGDVPLTNVTITDPNVVMGTCTPSGTPVTLLPTQTLSCTATHVVVLDDDTAGSFVNTASGDSDQTDPVTDAVTVPIDKIDAMSIKKVITSTAPYQLGDTLNYSITVTNLGTSTLNGVTVIDPGTDVTLGTCTPGQPSVLTPGTSMVCAASHVVTQPDVDLGSFTNTAIADSVETDPPISDTVIVNIKKNPQLNVFKQVTSNGPYNTVGSVITYDISTVNSGDETLHHVTLVDNTPGVVMGTCTPATPATLVPGAILSCAASHTVTAADLTNGGYTNTATGDSDETPSASDTVTVITKTPSIILDKVGTLNAGGNGRADAGDTISYAFTITNNGEVTLTDIKLTDIVGGITITGGPTIASLAPGDVNSTTFTGTYTLKQSDIDAGTFSNTATATGYPPIGSPVSSTDTDTKTGLSVPSLQLDKVITSGESYNHAGAVIYYSYTIMNNGNVALTGNSIPDGYFTITDDHINGGTAFSCGTAVSLAIGASINCTNSYTVTQADIDGGDSIVNTANAHGKFVALDVTSNTDTATAAELTPWPASLAKSLVTTEFNVSGNDHTQAVIGEILTYQLVTTFPSGSTMSAKVVDTLDAGLALVAVDSVTVSNRDSDGASVNADAGLNSEKMTFDSSGNCTNCTASATNGVGVNPFVETSGGKLTFDFGNVINTSPYVDGTNTGAETITIIYRAIVLNDINNQSLVNLNNSAVFSWTGDQASASAAAVTVVEPTLTLSKSLLTLPATIHDAGDTASFSITVTNGNAASGATVAHDVEFTDIIPSGLTLVSSPTLGACDASPTFGGTTTLTASWISFPVASSCTFTFNTTVNADVLPGQTIAANTGELRWTSISGTRADLSPFNTASDERIGPTGIIGSDSLNDYGVESPASAITLDNVLAQKSIIATSEAHTDDPNAATGEIIRYRLVMQLPEGVVTDLQLSDTFGGTGGQRFLDDNTARVLFVGNGSVSSAVYGSVPAVSACANYGGDFTLAGTSAILSSAVNCSLADANITAIENSDVDTYPTNGGVHFQLGTITNGDNDVNPEFIIVEFNALVTNETANVTGSTLTDSFIGRRWNGTAMVNMGNASPSVSSIAREPSVTVSKVLMSTPLDAGDTVTYQMTITAGGTSLDHATAFELELTDVLDNGFTPVSQVIDSTTQASICSGDGSGTTVYADQISRIGQAVTLTATCLDPGNSITATIIAKVAPGAAAGATIPNSTAIIYTSLPGAHGTTANDTGSVVTTDPGTPTGERTGSGIAPNTYVDSDNVSLTLDVPGIVKNDATPAVYTIGETVSYDIRITLPEGVTPSLVVTDNIPSGTKPTGSLPYGFKYVSSQILASDAALSNAFSGPTDVTLISGVCANACASGDDVTFTFNDVTTLDDNNTANNTFIIRIVLLVENITGNQDRIPTNAEYPTSLINSAMAVYTGGTINDSAAAITIIEPQITTTKSVSPTTSVKAGDTLTYTVRFTNSGDSTAYDVTALDTMAQGVIFGSITSCNYFNGASTSPIGFTQPTAGIVSVPFDSDIPGNWDIPATATDSYIECIYTGVAQNTMVLNGSHTNSIDADWTSLDGVNANERNYSDTVSNNMDGTQDTATATFTTGVVTLSKSDGGITQRTIGDSITYTITVGGANVLGTLRSLVVTDTLPAGLIYDGGVVFSGFSTSPVPTFGTNNGSVAVVLTFNFGDTVKSADNATITFNAHVADVTGNARTVVKTNSVSASYLNVAGTTVNLGPATDAFTIIEPVITTTKSVSPTANVKAGDTLTYTVRFTNSGDSTAYDVTALDTMAQGVIFGSITSCNYFNGASTSPIGFTQPTAGIVSVPFDSDIPGSWDIPATATDSYIECVYTGVAQSTLYLDGNHVNSVDADWTSQDGTANAGERVYADVVSRANVDGTQDTATATFTTGAPTITKDDGGVVQTVIGQKVSFTLSITSPLGTLQNAKVEDSLPAGFIYVAGSQVVSAGVSAAAFSTTVPVDGSASGKLTWDFGSAVVSASPFTIKYDAIVANAAGNQNYTVMANTATLSYTNIASLPQSLTSSATSTITEPILTVGKTAASVAVNPVAGDEITYTVTIAHDTNATLPDSTATAYNVNLNDVLPIYADLQIGTVSVSGTGAATVINTSNDGTNTVTIAISDIPIGTTAVVTYKAILTAALVPNQQIVNTADIDWSSQPGDNNPGAVDGERDGSGLVNDYNNSATATKYAANLIPVKSIVSTSEAHTLETGDGSNNTDQARALAVGEILRYRMEVVIPEGTSTSLILADALPLGLSYLGNPKISIISTIPMTVPADLNGAQNGAVPPTFDLPIAHITVSGQDVTFALGDFINNDADVSSLDVEKIVVDFNVLVNNDANNQNSTIHDNLFTTSISGGTPVSSNHVYSTVVEPVLLLGKTANASTNWKYNDTVTYTLSITSPLASSADAFNLRIADRIPSGLTYVPLSITAPAGWVADATGAPDLVWTCDLACALLLDGTADFTYQVKVDAPPSASALVGNATVTNNALLTFTSLPGNTGTTGNGTGSDTPGISGAANGERNGSSGGINTYSDPASHTGGVTPYYSIGNRVWFDTDNSGTMNGSELGVSGVLVQLFAASDTNFTTALASDTTNAAGFYLFDYLEPGDYVIVIPSSNFTGIGKLVGYWSSGTTMDNTGSISESAAIDVDIVATDADDNGKRQIAAPIAGAVITLPITLGATEPTGELAAQLESGVFGEQGAQPDNRANMTVDFGFYQTEIGGLLWTEGGTVVDGRYVLADDGLISGNTVRLYSADGLAEIATAVLSGVGGDYLFSGLPDGNYVVKVSETTGMISTLDTFDQADNNDPNTNTDNNDNGDNDRETAGVVASNPVDSAPGSTGIKTNSTVSNITGTTTNLTLDFGFASRYSVGNRVWLDSDNNGAIDVGEIGASGVTVQLFAANGLGQPTGLVLDQVTTNGTGYYLFDNLFPGEYVVVIPSSNFSGPLTGYWSSLTHMNSAGITTETDSSDPDDANQLDDNGMLVGSDVISKAILLGPIGATEPINESDAPAGQGAQPDDHANMTLDFGFFQPATLGDFVWNDTNYNGIQDAGETGVNAVQVDLYTGADQFVETATTNASGIYKFTSLLAGDYYVIFTLPNGYVFSPKNTGADVAKDSNADIVTGQTAAVTLTGGETNNTIDAAMYVAAPALSIVKTASPLTYNAVGNVISYSYLVTNSGNVILYAPFSVADDKTINENCPVTASLAPGVSITCTSSYTITQTDLDVGSVINTASASAEDAVSNSTVTSLTDSETVTAIQNPSMTVAKSSTTVGLSAPGTVNYSYLVTNTGNVTLTNIVLVDDNDTAAGVSCPVTTLAPAATTTCSASHNFTQAELDANGSPTALSGSLTNNVTASSTEAADATDTLSIPITQNSALAIVKTALPTTYNIAGDVISYSYLVTNTGNITLTGPFTVSDDKAADEDCPATVALSPNGTITCTASYTITQTDMDNGSVTNIASVSNGTVTSATDTETVTAIQSPSLGIVKTALPITYSAVGDVISYSYLVTNTGNITLSGPFTVSDDKAADESCPATVTLPPSGTITCTASYTINQTDLDNGFVTNIAFVSNGMVTSATDTETVTAIQSPSLSIVKTALPITYNVIGNVISYSYLVTNTGNITLAGPFTVSDDKAADESCPVTVALPPNGTITCTATYTITQPDLDNGSVTNTASVSNGIATSPTDTETVTAAQGPALSIVKTASPITYALAGDVISYSYLVTNTGNITLSGPFTVSDDKAADESCPATVTLPPSATITCTASYTITQADMDNGFVTNIASVSNGTITSPADSETVSAIQNPLMTVVKSSTTVSLSAPRTVNYSYLVTNAGNMTLTNITLVDDNDNNDISCLVATLVPAEATTCTASHTFTQAELDANGSPIAASGNLTNNVTASSNESPDALDTLNIPIIQTPALSIVKTASPLTYSAVGDVISYSYLVTNTGNITLAGPFTVSDDKAADESCPVTATLLPNGTITCTASYTITQTDLDNGSVTNIASVSNGVASSLTDSETVTAIQSPSLSIVKTANPVTYSAVDDVISYSYLVTNTGNITLAGPFTVSDDKAADESCPVTATLLPNGTITCTASYTITQTDLDNGSVTNIASVSNGVATSATDSETVTAIQNPALTVLKSSTSTELTVPVTVQYSYLVTNIGNVTLTGISLTDNNDNNDMTCPAATLIPTDTMTCSATHTFTQAELDAGGTLDNIVTASSNESPDATDTLSIPIAQNPLMTVEKSSLNASLSVTGVVGYNYLVRNTGNVTLTGINLADDNDTAAGVSCPVTTLAPAATTTCTASHDFTQAELDANGSPTALSGSLTNNVTASSNESPDALDTLNIPIVQIPALSIVKTANPVTYNAVGDVINYDYVVTNIGNVSLAGPFTVNDDKSSDENCPITVSLLPGGTITCTASYTITQIDLDNGSVTNSASVSNGIATSLTDSETVTAIQSPSLSIVKTAQPVAYNAVGTVINYSYVVTNTGNVSLAGPFTVNDDKTTDESCPAAIALSPGAAITCTASYTITQADINYGSVTNIASVSNGIVTSPTDSETVIAAQAPAINIVKTPSATVINSGATVTYSYVVTNPGNISLNSIVVADDKCSPVSYVSGDANSNNILEPAEWWNYTCSSVLTTTTTNIATVSGTFGITSVQDTDTATVNVVTTDFSKFIVGTSEIFTSGENVAIGEIITYQVTMNLSRNMTLSNVVITDRMDKGLAFVDCVSAVLSGTDIKSAVCPPAVSSITDPADLVSNPANPGRQIQFNIGNITAPATDSQLVIQYRAIVLDVIENQENDELNNGATITWTSGSLTASAPNVLIVEPDLAIQKSAAQAAVTTNSFVEFKLVISHTPNSSGDAFDVVVTDVLPDGLVYIACAPIVYSGYIPSNQPDPCNILDGDTLTFGWDNFPLGETATIAFFARFDGVKSSVENLASVAWTSLPIDMGEAGLPVQMSAFNETSTERWYDPLDAINVYQVTDSVTITALPQKLPETGFAPNLITALPEQSLEKSYLATDLWVNIPRLGVNIPIVGVPMVGNDWDLSWLWNQAGWLNGTAFPGWQGNSALTGHVTLSNGNAGPFAGLGKLKWGDKILVHSYGSVYTYEVRENRIVTPYNTSVLKHEETAWLTLITCKTYNEKTETYSNRIAVRAVLVKVDLEK